MGVSRVTVRYKRAILDQTANTTSSCLDVQTRKPSPPLLKPKIVCSLVDWRAASPPGAQRNGMQRYGNRELRKETIRIAVVNPPHENVSTSNQNRHLNGRPLRLSTRASKLKPALSIFAQFALVRAHRLLIVVLMLVKVTRLLVENVIRVKPFSENAHNFVKKLLREF